MHAFLEKGVGSQRTGTVRIFRGTPMSNGKRQKTCFRCAMTSSPGTKDKSPRMWGSWASTVEESFEKFVAKHSDVFVPNEAGRLRKLMQSPGSSRETAVATVHQIYGLFRDGRPMPHCLRNHRPPGSLGVRGFQPVVTGFQPNTSCGMQTR